jgi:hypothetical protein
MTCRGTPQPHGSPTSSASSCCWPASSCGGRAVSAQGRLSERHRLLKLRCRLLRSSVSTDQSGKKSGEGGHSPGCPWHVTRRRTRAPPLRHAALPAPDGGRSSGSSPAPSDRVETVPARTSGAPGASASSVDPLVQWVAGRISRPAYAPESTLLSYPADAIRSWSSTPHLRAARSSTSPSASAPVSRRSSRVLRIPAERGVRPAIRRGRPAAALRPRRCPGRCPRRAWHGRGRT